MPRYETPRIGTGDLWDLWHSDYEDAVLFLKCGPDNEGGEPLLEVWTEAYVPHHQVVLRRTDMVDTVDPTGAAKPAEMQACMTEALPFYQQEVDQVFQESYDA